MVKRIIVIVALVAVVVLAGAACKSKKKTTGPGATSTPGAVSGEALPVNVDAVADFAASFIAYFPKELTAHPGDTVQFTSHFTGEPHTVTLGTQVDDVFNLIAEACPNGGLADPACQQGPPPGYEARYNAADGKNPGLITGDNPADFSVPQAAAQPCFLATGAPPTDDSACTEQTQTDFDGTQTFYNSGWLEDQQVYTVRLADNIAPGTYNFYCLLHREGMSGTITVVDANTPAQTPAEVAQAGQAQLATMVTGLQPEVERLGTLTAGEAQAGGLSDAVQEATINEFAPKEIDIPVGGSVTWNIVGGHTISFNAPESARPLLTKAADGAVSPNEESFTPAISPGQPAPDPNAPTPDPNAPPPDPNAPPTVIDGGTWDGQGFFSSGFIDAFDAPWQYKLTFSAPGTYTYICLIHTDMEGTIKVGG